MQVEVPGYILGSLLFYAFRYSLGRRTYATSEMVDYLTRYWYLLAPHEQVKIKQEIAKAIETGNAGSQIDIDDWKKILELN